jgi:hypothetical protein
MPDLEEALRQGVLARLELRRQRAAWDRLEAALSRVFRAPDPVSDAAWNASWADIERRAKSIGQRPQGVDARGRPVSDEFKRRQWNRYQELRRAYYARPGQAGPAAVFNSVPEPSPQARRLFRLDG